MSEFFEQLTDVCHSLLLDNNELMFYLKERRGMTDSTIRDYKLGAFPTDLRDLYNRYNMSPTELKEQSIIVNASHSPFKLYPIVIPVRSVTGESIAIGCRTLVSEEKRKQLGIPKYRNSSYKKTSHLFGLDKSVSGIRKADKVFIVEGYFDAITAHQAGIKNVVATCGTMFHERQLIILSRYTRNICLLFDNDGPGRRSANKVLDKLKHFDKDINLTCSYTPDGYKDLDEYIKSGGSMDCISAPSGPNDEIKTLW